MIEYCKNLKEIFFGFIIFFASFLIFNFKVGAYSSDRWLQDLDYIKMPNLTYYNCNSEKCATSVSTELWNIGYDDLKNPFPTFYASNLNVAWWGYAMQYLSNVTFKQNYLYTVSTYVCSNVDLGNLTYFSSSGSSAGGLERVKNNEGQRFQYFWPYRLSNAPLAQTTEYLNSCYVYTDTFSPLDTGNYYTLRLSSNVGYSNVKLYTIGYTIAEHGLYDHYLTMDLVDVIVKSIEKNTGNLATQSDINKINDSIKNSTDSINNSLGDINNSITDDSVDSSGANSFFSGFKDVDHGGISGVITAPLRAINKITDQCSPISFTIFDQNIALPCGDQLFWNKTEVEGFRTTWNIMLGGSIIYALLLKLFKVIEGLKNPDDSRIEVLKL